ncbi:MAG: anthranilate synthase component I family protein [Deferribacteres bacterium]|nr:anthranilate synthase component I family protein [Deferribacteres bacterium]
MLYPDYEDFAGLWDRYDRIPVYKELMTDIFTPSLFLMAHRNRESLFLLESADVKKDFSRFTFFGFPEEVYSAEDDPFSFLKSVKASSPVYKDFGGFTGGLVGILGYGASNYTGLLRKKVREGEDLGLFMKVERFFVMDNFRQRLFAVCVVKRGKTPLEDYTKAGEILEGMEKELLRGCSSFSSSRASSFQVESDFTKREFEERVKALKAEIERGEAIQVVLSQRLTLFGENLNPVNFYRMLRRINPSPYMFFLKFGGRVFCGSSPEVHLKVSGGKAYMKPIAGTYPVGKNIEEIAARLKSDEKERAEHLMLVDLARNDLYTYCEPETVSVPDFMEAEVYSHVIHLVSSVVGSLREGIEPVELLRMTFPAGTVSGAPKVRAQELIDEYEVSPRDFYAGCVGYMSYSGELDTCITIRSARFEKGKVTLRAGAGIVYDSVPEKEYEEVNNKLKALMEAVKRAHELGVCDAFAGG